MANVDQCIAMVENIDPVAALLNQIDVYVLFLTSLKTEPMV